ncbi:hypothetical protein DPMN_181793 [Dreissena polymorpha]|uniref:Uncharacterized protein n=1 Tax=Dreissena polymorpha TaxID=45954 RepID=A0A9D4I4R3_DREPO|nr:hypothetical protein DPMN_181793 [Dreissena polymorpha]
MHTCFLLLRGALSLSAGKDWFPVACLELLLCAQEAWNQEVKEGPEVQDVVLYWGTGQDQTVGAVQLLHSLGDLVMVIHV